MAGSEAPRGLFDKVSVLHSTAEWQGVFDDVRAVLGEPRVTDSRSWAQFVSDTTVFSLGDETELPPWCLLGKTRDLDAVITWAVAAGWTTGEPVRGGHETRVVMTSPHGLTVIAYAPLA